MTPAELEALAQQDLEADRFREAVNRYKELLKTEPRPEWQAGLAAAYAGRAQELAAKGMQKEALAIWQNREQLCPAATPAPAHLLLLVRSGQGPEAVGRYRSAVAQLDPVELAELRSHFAALYLSGAAELESGLPADDPVIVHGTAARAALTAYCCSDEAAVTKALAQIPFRSPYRDWVQLLKALLQLPDDVPAVERLLQRVPANSPFSPVREAVRLAMLPELDFLAEAPQAGEAAQHFAAALRGWPAQRLALWRELRKLGDTVRPQVWLAFLYRHRDLLGAQWVERGGLRLLTQDFPASRRWPKQQGGRLPSSLEEDLVEAWQAEASEDPWRVLDAWTAVTQKLRHPAEPAPGSDDALRIALIQRRLDTRWKLLDFPADDYYSEQISQQTIAQMEDSLHLDPDDQPTYVRLISHYRTKERLKDARRLLEPALQRWPEDPVVLQEALETALAGNAFKKAATLAHRILARDPINSRARNSLLGARLAHARKQLMKGRVDLAEKELAAAEEWAQGQKASRRVELLRGFLALQQDRTVGATALRTVTERLGGDLTARLDLAIEASGLRQPLGPLMKQLGLPKLRSPENKADLSALLHRLRELMDGGEKIPREILDFFAPALKAGSKLELTAQESESACETLRRCALHAARLAYARAALKRWPESPVFELHAFESKYEGRYYRLSHGDIERLEGALARARASGDMRTAHRIQEVMHQLPFMPFPPFALPPELDEPDDEFPNPADGLDIDAVLDMIDHSGEMRRELKEIEQIFGRERLLEMLQDLVNEGLPDEVDDDVPIDLPLPKPPRKRRKSGANKPKKPGKKAGAQDASTSEPPDKPDQLDLFK